MRDELVKARTKYKALAAAGLVLDARTGEIVSMVSVPDYDPNNPREALDPSRINRLTTGVFEMGSTFKALTLAMAIDSGRMKSNSVFDARGPLQYGKHTINDYRGRTACSRCRRCSPIRRTSAPRAWRWRSASSTTSSFCAGSASSTGCVPSCLKAPSRSFRAAGREINTVTIAFGHGLSVSPLQAMMANAALVNGGLLIPPTLRKRTEEEAMQVATRVLKPDASEKMRYLMRLNAEKGAAKRADVDGFYVGGKTGTSEKVVNGRYVRNKLLNTFTAVFPRRPAAVPAASGCSMSRR